MACWSTSASGWLSMTKLSLGWWTTILGIIEAKAEEGMLCVGEYRPQLGRESELDGFMI